MTITENLHFERYDTVETGILRHILRQTKGQYQNTNIRPDLIPFDKFEGVTSIPKIQALVAQAEATTRQLHPKRLRDKSYKRDADDNYILDTHGKKKLIKNGTTRIVEAVFTFNIGNSQPLTPYEKTKFNAWKQFYLQELAQTLPKTWKQLFVVEHHSELSEQTHTMNGHIHIWYLPLDTDHTLNARQHLKLENHFISLQQHNERKKRLTAWAQTYGIAIKESNEVQHAVSRNIHDLKEITKQVRSKVLVSQSAQELTKVRKSLDSKLKAFGYQSQDFNYFDQDIPAPQHHHGR